MEVLDQDPTIFGILSLGSNAQEVLDGLPTLPSNLAVRESVAQLELLPVCDAFITHGGANSMHEALSMRVPLAVVPVFGDQILNADSVAYSGAGFSFRHPLLTLSVATLSDALQQLLSPDPANRFRIAASAVAEEIKQAGGIQAAVNAILDCLPKYEENLAAKTQGLPTLLQSAFAIAGDCTVSPSDVMKQSYQGDSRQERRETEKEAKA